jgi:hypothetical protein
MTTADITRRSFPAWAPLLLLVVGIVSAATAVILLARRAAEPDAPPPPPAFQAPSANLPVTALDVQQVAGGRLTLSDGSRDVALRPDARVERLERATAEQVRVGDWLAVIGIPNEVRNFSIRSLVLLGSDPAPAGVDGVVRSRGGFAGYEASRDQSERPLLAGRVTGVAGMRLSLEGPTGPMMVDLTPQAPLYRLVEGRAADLQEGDRIAFHAGGSSAGDATSVLVLPGGAR